VLNASRVLRFGGAVAGSPDRLVHGDNLTVTAGLPDRSLDLVYIDPPFGTGARRRGRGGAAYSDQAGDPEAFVANLAPRLAESRRLLVEHGSLFVHLDYRASHYVKVALDRLFGRERMVNEIIWCYSVGGKGERSFGRKHDSILWYSRTADYAFYPDAVRIARKPASHMRLVRGPDGALVQEKTDRRTGRVYRYPVASGKVPEDWWTDIETLNRGDRERTGWPTQKPERLLERIVAAASAPTSWVADWFAGSGTTAVVAQRLGRRFIAVDCEAEAIRLAARRLAEAGAALAGAGKPPPDVVLESPQTGPQKPLSSAHPMGRVGLAPVEGA
jgi:DNA modification methylase